MPSGAPLYVIGLDGEQAVLARDRLRTHLTKYEARFGRIDEARLTAKTHERLGGERAVEAGLLVMSRGRRLHYSASGRDLHEVCESLGAKILSESKPDRRRRSSIRRA